MGRLFGTDGVRGVVNKELTADLAMKVGNAAARVLTEADGKRPVIALGMDTRISGDFLAHSSYRVTGNAVMMGEAAGYFAATGKVLPPQIIVPAP